MKLEMDLRSLLLWSYRGGHRRRPLKNVLFFPLHFVMFQGGSSFRLMFQGCMIVLLGCKRRLVRVQVKKEGSTVVKGGLIRLMMMMMMMMIMIILSMDL